MIVRNKITCKCKVWRGTTATKPINIIHFEVPDHCYQTSQSAHIDQLNTKS